MSLSALDGSTLQRGKRRCLLCMTPRVLHLHLLFYTVELANLLLSTLLKLSFFLSDLKTTAF